MVSFGVIFMNFFVKNFVYMMFYLRNLCDSCIFVFLWTCTFYPYGDISFCGC